VVNLMRRALGAEAVPEILTTRRQRTEREREIAGLFREGKAAEALAMKREDGTAEAVPGGYDDADERRRPGRGACVAGGTPGDGRAGAGLGQHPSD
jgi:hypothetical protein